MIDLLNIRLVDGDKQTVIEALETCDANHNKAFIKGTLRSALNELLMFILDNISATRKPLEPAMIQATIAAELLPTIAATTIKIVVVMAYIVKFAAELVKKEVDRSVEDPALTLSSLSPPCLDLSASESHNDYNNMVPKKKSYGCSPNLKSSEKDTRSLEESLRETVISSRD